MPAIPEHTRPEGREGTLPLLERYRGPVDQDLRGMLTGVRGLSARMIEYHLGFRDEEGKSLPDARADGKLVRPTLVLLTADATSGLWMPAVPAATAIELHHNYTLMHDDVMDGDRKRHGKRTVWDMWGEAQAINTGDMANLLSAQSLLRLQDHGYPAETVVRASQLLTQTGIELTQGQAADLAFETRTDVTVEEYLEMIRGKTGVLIETSVALGAVLGKADKDTTAKLRRYGANLGRAFQIVDDKLGIWGDPKKIGKAQGGDIRRRKQAFPALDALKHAEGPAKAELERFYGSTEEATDADVARVMAIMEEVGTKQRTQDMVDQATADAIAAIDDASVNHKEDFKDLAVAFATRQK